MALPTTNDAKSYLRIETADEDTLVGQLLARALASIEGFLGYAMTAVERVHVDYDERDNYGVQPRLHLPGPFKTEDPAPVVENADGDVVDAANYYLDPRNLRILARPYARFRNRPYSITATIGLSAHPDYASRYEAIATIAILDLVSHLYFIRNPAIVSESDEGGGTRTLTPDEIPPRIRADLMQLPGAAGMVIQ